MRIFFFLKENKINYEFSFFLLDDLSSFNNIKLFHKKKIFIKSNNYKNIKNFYNKNNKINFLKKINYITNVYKKFLCNNSFFCIKLLYYIL